MDGIFISYRRDDSAGYAGRLYDRLAAHFGTARVFMDVEGIEPGIDFVNAIEDAVGSCRVLIVVIGDEWTDAVDAAGRRRLEDPNDFVRLETAAALKRGIRVVPVLVGGAVMPRVTELPDELQSLTRRQAIEISHKQWDASTGELIRTLERILETAGAAATSAPQVTVRPPVTSASTAAPHRPWAIPLAGGATLLALVGGVVWYGGARTTESPEIAQGTPAPTAAKSNPSTIEAPEPSGKSQPKSKPAAEIGAVAVPTVAAPAAAVPAPASPPAPVPAPPTMPVQGAAPPPAAVAKASPPVKEARGRAEVVVAPSSTEVPVAPPAASSPPAQVAIAPPTAPAATPSASSPGGMPNRGESWTYRSSGKWPTSPKRSFQIVVQSAADGVITDTLRMIDPAGSSGEARRSRGGKPDFISWPELGIEFSPYLGVLGELSRLEAQSGFPTPELDAQWSQWYSRLKWLGQESVSVPAGTFNSHKVEVWSNRHATGTRVMRTSEPVGVHYYVWYAPEVKRYVKMQRRILAASGTELENDVIEMVARAP